MNGPFENNLVAYSGLTDQFYGRDLAGNAALGPSFPSNLCFMTRSPTDLFCSAIILPVDFGRDSYLITARLPPPPNSASAFAPWRVVGIYRAPPRRRFRLLSKYALAVVFATKGTGTGAVEPGAQRLGYPSHPRQDRTAPRGGTTENTGHKRTRRDLFHRESGP